MYTSVLVRVLARVGVNVVLIVTGGHSIRVNGICTCTSGVVMVTMHMYRGCGSGCYVCICTVQVVALPMRVLSVVLHVMTPVNC